MKMPEPIRRFKMRQLTEYQPRLALSVGISSTMAHCSFRAWVRRASSCGSRPGRQLVSPSLLVGRTWLNGCSWLWIGCWFVDMILVSCAQWRGQLWNIGVYGIKHGVPTRPYLRWMEHHFVAEKAGDLSTGSLSSVKVDRAAKQGDLEW